MADAQQYRVIIGMGINPGDANRVIQEAQGTYDRMQRIWERTSRAQAAGGGILDPKQVERFGNQLNRVVEDAFKRDIANSPLFQSMSRQLQAYTRLGGTKSFTETAPSIAMESRLRLVQAELARTEHQRRAAVPFGDTRGEGVDKVKGYANLAQALAAETRTTLAIERANKAIAKTKLDYIADFGRSVNSEINAQQRAARIIQQEANDRQKIRDQINQAHYRRMNAEDALNRAEVKRAQEEQERAAKLAAVDTQVASAMQTSYPGATAATPTGRAQVGINRAELALEAANQGLANARSSETRTVQSVLAAENRVLSASNGLAAARERLAAMEARSASAGIGSQFMSGFRGQSERPYAEQIGQAFKFSVFYGTAYKLLFAFTATLQQTLQEGIEFQQAVTELKLATDRSQEAANDLANSLGERATEAGFAPSQGVLAGARAVGLYGATQASSADQDRIAEMSARTASRLAFSSGLQIADVQTNLAAIGNAFGGGPEAQFRTADLDAYMAHRFGVAPGQTIQAVAEAGTVGAAAGFSQEGVNAIAALLMGRTGQTAPAVAGYMAQIFSRGGEGVLGGITSKYGIDPSLTLADQIKELARIYKTASSGEQTEIASGFGRGKVQNAMVVLLQQFGDVLEAERAAKTDAGGAADEAFGERIANIGGQIQKTVATMQEFANQLGQSGLLHAVGLGIVIFRELVEAGTGVLRVWNSLNGPIKAVVAGMIALAVAQRAGVAGALASRFGPAAAIGSGATAGVVARSAGAAALATLANPVVAATAGLLAIGALKNTSNELASAQKTASDALLNSGLGSAATPDELRARASELGAAASDARDSAQGLRARIINLGADRGENLDLAGRAETEQKRLDSLAKTAEERATSTPPPELITGFDPEGLSSSLQTMEASGATAQERFDALSAALRGSADAAIIATESFDRNLFAGTRAQGALEAITGSVSLGKSTPSFGDIIGGLATHSGTGDPIDDRTYKNIAPALIEEALSQSDIQKRLQSAMADISNLGEVTPEKAREIATTVVGDTAKVAFADQGLPKEEIQAAQELMISGLAEYLIGETRDVREIVEGGKRFNDTELMSAIGKIQETTAGVLENLPETDYKGRVQANRQAVREIMQAIRQSDDGAPDGAYQQLDVARRALARSQFAELEAARKAAQQSARGKREIARVGRGFLRKEIAAAIRGGDRDLLAQIIGQAGEGAIALARAMLQDAADAARAAQALRAKALRLKAAASAALSGAIPGTVFEKKDPGNYGPLIDSLDTTIHGDESVYATGSDVPGLGDAAAAAEEKETAAERRAALMAANAVRSESGIAAAKAEIASARAAMANAEKGSVEYYNALSSYYSARNALTDAILEYRNNKMLLGIDMTDPLAQARVAYRAAMQKLRSDRGKGADVVAADRVAAQQAQSDLEATKFQQRLDSVQTAEELGRISHQKYINYLQNEHDRLERIKNRTFQQQEQLDSIDRLLKEAAGAMDAQWNFGDINLPKPYQVRRYIEQQSDDAKSRAGLIGDTHARSTTTIYIDGAETGKVQQIIRQYVGQTARTRTTSPRRT